MARRPREDYAGAIQHVIAKGSGGESIVRDDVDRTALVDLVGATVLRHRWSCLAYCLLDTHFHLLVATPAANLGRGMQWLLAAYARDFNKRHDRHGNLFHTRFYSRRVTSGEHLLSALMYVHLNPVRAGVVERAELHRWSSYATTISPAPRRGFVDIPAALELVDSDPANARIRLELALHQTLERDRERAGVRHSV